MANHKAPKRPCSIPGCKDFVVSRGFCQRHYDGWYAQIRIEKQRQRRKDKPFLGVPNPYRVGTGYYILVEAIRQNQPMTIEQILRIAKAELAKSGRIGYRLDYAFEVIKSKRHASRQGEYELRQDAKKRWHLMAGRGSRGSFEAVQHSS